MNLKFKVRKKPIVLDAEIARKEKIIHTLEGDMTAHKGDVIITGIDGEQYPVATVNFKDKTISTDTLQFQGLSDNKKKALTRTLIYFLFEENYNG